jgi:hypothetical protein
MASDQQALHDLITVLSAPGLALSQSDGQIAASGAQGWYSREIRALRRLEITLENASMVPVGVRAETASVTVHSVITGLADLIADPRVLLSRERAVTPSTLTDRVRLTNHGPKTVSVRLRARVDSDLAGIDAVRGGRPVSPVLPLWHGDQLRWEGENVTISLRYTPAPDESGLTGETAELRWRVDLPPGESWSLELAATSAHGPVPAFAPTAPASRPQWTELPDELVRANLADLEGLLLADPQAPDDRFVAAGAPWYLTLFGRDALWTARMLLPLDRSLAAGTLRALARRQGARHDPEAEEAPGKILHEARPAPQRFAELRLPAIYYGTIDATALWVCLLHDAWQAGLPEAEVAALLPNLVAAMDWITGADADPDGDGLIEYAGSARGGRDPPPRRALRGGTGRAVRGPGVRLRGRGRRGDAGRGVRAERGLGLAVLGQAAAGGVPPHVLAARRGRTVPGDRAGRGQAPGFRRGVEHGPPAGHRPTGRGPGPGGGRPAGRARPAHRVRPAHLDHAQRRVQPAELPLRQRLAARHRDRDHGPGRRGPHRAGRRPGVRAAARGGPVRRPAPRAVRGAGGRDAGALPVGVPPAGLGGGRDHRGGADS